ncbi:hypothetical protein WAI453_001095 [Rhynchosporium graminicola]
MALIECADKFAMGELYCVLLYDMIRRRLIDDEMNGDKRGRIQPSDVELVYRVTQDGDPLRTLVAQDVLSYEGPAGKSLISALFRLKEKEIPDFAFEILQQFRQSVLVRSVPFWARIKHKSAFCSL